MKLQNLKIYYSLAVGILKSKLTQKKTPLIVSFYFTNHCNLRCTYCFVVNDDVPKEIMKSEFTKQETFDIVDELYDMGTRMIFLLGGEPLIHEHIGEIADYITNKGIYCDITTNGVLLSQKADQLHNVNAICVSLDGVDEDNDYLRGKGVFDKAIKGIKASIAAGIPTRIHTVLNRRNLHSIRKLAELARELGVWMTISPINVLRENNTDESRISNEEYKAFWNEYLGLKKEGFPIGNAYDSINECINWPKDYHEYIKIGEKFDNFKPTPCVDGFNYFNLHADGTMYNCIALTKPGVGPNIKELGIRGAFEKLSKFRPDCASCSWMNHIEKTRVLEFRLSSIISAIRFHLLNK